MDVESQVLESQVLEGQVLESQLVESHLAESHLVGSHLVESSHFVGNQESQVAENQEKILVEQSTMLPPSRERFKSREELIGYARSYAMSQGYMLSIKRSKKNRVLLGCNRGGTYRNRKNVDIHQRRRRCSRLINCPFMLLAKRKRNGSWVLQVKELVHNHGASEDISARPLCRQFSVEERQRIKKVTAAYVSPSQVVSILKESNPDLQIESRDVYNVKAKIRRANLSGRSPVQALFDELVEGGFQYFFKNDEDNQLTHLFIAHPKSIALSQSYPNIFVMDCSYKNNRYKMPLLNIIGMTSFNTTFFSCFVFLQKEEEEDYIWALKMFDEILGSHFQPRVIISNKEVTLMKAIQVVFPMTVNLFGVWHVEKDIIANCKTHFEDKDQWNTFSTTWASLIDSSTEELFYKAWETFVVTFREKSVVLNYIANSWLQFKERFVKAWTEKHPHFGNCVNSKAKGAHSLFKSYLSGSTGDIEGIKYKLCLAVENQFNEINTRLSTERNRIPHNVQIHLFSDLVTHVSIFALRELVKQYELTKADSPLPVCTNQFTTTMGLPCAHIMKLRMDSGEILHLGDIHPQWRIDHRSFDNVQCIETITREDHMKQMLDDFQRKYQQWSFVQQEYARSQLAKFVESLMPMPMVKVPKTPTAMITRVPSDSDTAEKTRKCSFCKQLGHNTRTCPIKKSAFPQSDALDCNEGQNISSVSFGGEGGDFSSAI